MKNIFRKIKENILVSDLIFIFVNIILNFILYLLNIRFRIWVIILIVCISVLGFIIGIIKEIYKTFDNKKQNIIFTILSIISILLLLLVFLPIIGLTFVFKYMPEHTVTLNDKKYVAVVRSFLHVDVDYYNYYGPFLMGTKAKVHGYFGKGGYDPFEKGRTNPYVEYTYYDNNGKVIKKTHTSLNVNNEIEENSDYDSSLDNIKINESDRYLLPEDAEVLYEKKFGKTILRFVKVDNVLAGNILVSVIKSTDNGKNFYSVTDNVLQVSEEAKYKFLNEKLGFASKSKNIFLEEDKVSLYVTNDGGKTFSVSKIMYENDNVEYITIEKMPYFENEILKMKCSIYELKNDKSEYENKALIFKSIDNGLTFTLE